MTSEAVKEGECLEDGPVLAIPVAELEAAQRRFVRQVASTLIAAMSETDHSFAEIDAAVDMEENWAKQLVDRLLACKDVRLDELALFFLGCGVEGALEFDDIR